MKILLTGAHFTPALAVIEELKKTRGVKITYVGRKTTLEGDKAQSVESKVLPTLGVKFIPIITGRLQRSLTIYTIPSLLKIPVGLLQAFWIILTEKPDVILSFGGYVSVPIVLMGWLWSVSIIVHEQTLVPGLANKITSLFADKIALSFEKDSSLSGKTILTGNPIRKEILNPVKNLSSDFTRVFEYSKKEKLPVILIMGGNQGSHTINKVVEQCLGKLLKMSCIIHVTGDNKYNDFERLEGLGGREGLEGYVVKEWVGEEIGGVYNKVDLVIARAGANTLTELAFLGKPALVIPLFYLYQDEQNKNAKYFESLNLVKILPQAKLSEKSLLENIKTLLGDLTNLKVKARMAKKAIIPDAAKRLALETQLLARRIKYEEEI